jgi:hypothetical protein
MLAYFFLARHELLLTSGRSSVTERYSLEETEAVLTYAKSVLTLSSYLGIFSACRVT